MWKELILDFAKGNANINLNPPATNEEILEVERILRITLPKQLKNLFSEFNGDSWFMLSTKQIIEINTSIRQLTGCMSLDCILLVAGNGCGDYFGYPITQDGIKEHEIFMWDHEYDNRVFVANGLKEVIEKYYTNKI